jgi:heptosyltransferase II
MDALQQSGAQARRTLVIQTLPGIGDMVWHMPYIKAIAESEASKVVDILTIKRSMADQLLASERHVSNILWLDDGLAGESRLGAILSLAKKLRALHYDRVWILHYSGSWALAAFLAGIPERWGYGIGWQRLFLNRGKYLGNAGSRLHPIDKAASFLQRNGLLAEDVTPTISVHAEAAAVIGQRFGACPRPWIAFGIGSTDPARQWGVDNFSRLAAMLSSRPGGTIFLVGGPAEQGMGEQIRNSVGAESSASMVSVIACPISEVSALLQACNLYVGNDTGMLNIAAAVGTPSVGLLGMGYSHRLADEGRNIYAVFPGEHAAEPGLSPMRHISVAAVAGKVEQLLQRRAADARSGAASMAATENPHMIGEV